MNNYFFGWTKIKQFITEVILTLTNKESRFSQKKILVYIIDLTMLATSLFYMYQHRAVMTAGDHCMIVGLWLAKGVSNVIMSQGDKKLDKEDNKEDDKPTEENK